MSPPPACSLIVVSRDRGDRLAATLAAGHAQVRATAEVIVVAGGPAGGGGAAAGDVVTVPGGTEAACRNAGLARSRGEWVHFLHAGDRLAGDGVVAEVLAWARRTEAGVVVGETAADDGRIERLSARVNALAGDFLPVAGAFYRRSLFEENGPFDDTLLAASAYEFHLRLWKGRVRFKPLPLRVAACAVRPPPAGPWRVWQEEAAVRRRYFPAHRALPWTALGLLRALGCQLRPTRAR